MNNIIIHIIIIIVRRVFDFNNVYRLPRFMYYVHRQKVLAETVTIGSRKRLKLPQRTYSCCNFSCLPIIFYIMGDNVIILISHISYPVTYLGCFHGGEVRGRDIKILIDILLLLLLYKCCIQEVEGWGVLPVVTPLQLPICTG